MARPTKMTPKLVDTICERLAVEPINRVFADPKLPTKQTYYNWIQKDAKFFDRSARARAIAALREMDEMEAKFDELEQREYTGVEVQLLRERLHHHRWKVSKLLPKTYGDKVSHELTGADGGPVESLQRIEVVVVDPSEDAEDRPA